MGRDIRYERKWEVYVWEIGRGWVKLFVRFENNIWLFHACMICTTSSLLSDYFSFVHPSSSDGMQLSHWSQHLKGHWRFTIKQTPSEKQIPAAMKVLWDQVKIRASLKSVDTKPSLRPDKSSIIEAPVILIPAYHNSRDQQLHHISLCGETL